MGPDAVGVMLDPPIEPPISLDSELG
jgi:hypothetical protein